MSATRSSELPLAHREGPDLDALVAQIAAEHPQPVRFLDVDRVRRGGVLGFFAKEQYALTYEVADAPSTPSPLDSPARHRSPHAAPRAAAEPVDLEDLLGRADARDARPALALVPPPETPGAPSEVAPGDRFADILYGLARDVVDEPIAPAVVPAVDVTGRHRAAAAFEPTPLGGVTPHAPVVEPERAPVLSARPERKSAPGAVPAPELEPSSAPVLQAAVLPPPVVVSDVIVSMPAAVPMPEAVAVPEAATIPVAAPALPSPVVRATAPRATAWLSAADARLLALGVPATHGAPAAADPDRVALVAALVGAVDALPVVSGLPSAAGDLVVVVGGAAAAAVSVPAVAALLGTEARPVAGRTAARTAVAAVRAGDAPGVLQIAADDPALADVVVGADLVVLAVEATGKTSDHRQLVARVRVAGGSVDALAVDRVTATSSPASVWELDLPVLTLDGHAADTARWLTLLLNAARDL